MKQESFDLTSGHLVSTKLQKIIKEHGEVYASQEMLRQRVDNYLQLVIKETSQNEFINVNLAKKISNICLELINDYNNVDVIQKKYINAAVNYFVATDDEEEDLFSPLGFDDDAEILNECLILLGRKNLIIEL